MKHCGDHFPTLLYPSLVYGIAHMYGALRVKGLYNQLVFILN